MERPLPSSGISQIPSIAIVDTGVRTDLKWLNLNLAGGVAVRQLDKSQKCVYDSNFNDVHGHGTEVASLFCTLTRGVPFYAVRIAQLHEDGCAVRVHEKVLAFGIDWCIEKGVRIVNISYSIEIAAKNGPLAAACRKASEKNVILLSSYRNYENRPVYPAAYPTVLGVTTRNGIDHAQVAIVSENNHDVAAFGGPYHVASLGNELKVVSGTSFATAQVTGMIARMLAIKPSLTFKQVFSYLKKYATE